MKYIMMLLVMCAFGLEGCNLTAMRTCDAAKDGYQACHYTVEYDNAPACIGSCDGKAVHNQKVL